MRGVVHVDPADRAGTKAPPARGRRPASSDTIGDIMTAARSEFARHGFDGARVEHIARQAKVSKQLLYHYFDGKSELYGLLLDEAAVKTSNLADRKDYESLLPDDALALFVNRIIGEYRSRPEIGRMTIDEAMHQCGHVLPRSSLRPIMQKLIDETLAPILERGAAAGTYRDDIDPALVFWMIFSMITTWFAHDRLIASVSGPRFEGQRGLETWRRGCVDCVIASVRR